MRSLEADPASPPAPAARPTRVALALTAADLPPHIQELQVEHLALFAVRADALADEFPVTSLSHMSGGQTVTAAGGHHDRGRQLAVR
jgi:hypothetical protein